MGSNRLQRLQQTTLVGKELTVVLFHFLAHVLQLLSHHCRTNITSKRKQERKETSILKYNKKHSSYRSITPAQLPT